MVEASKAVRWTSTATIERALRTGISLGLSNPTVNYYPDGRVTVSWHGGEAAQGRGFNEWD